MNLLVVARAITLNVFNDLPFYFGTVANTRRCLASFLFTEIMKTSDDTFRPGATIDLPVKKSRFQSLAFHLVMSTGGIGRFLSLIDLLIRKRIKTYHQ